MMVPKQDTEQGKAIDDYYDTCTSCEMKNGLHAIYCKTNLWFDLKKGRNMNYDSRSNPK